MNERIYFDNNATTRADDRVAEAMAPFLTEKYGNPNSLHEFGTEARRPLSEALDRLYAGIGAADEDTIIINGCATEGNNTVLKSAWISQILNGSKKQIIVSKVEHHSVSHTAEFLASQGAEIIELPVMRNGARKRRSFSYRCCSGSRKTSRFGSGSSRRLSDLYRA